MNKVQFIISAKNTLLETVLVSLGETIYYWPIYWSIHFFKDRRTIVEIRKKVKLLLDRNMLLYTLFSLFIHFMLLDVCILFYVRAFCLRFLSDTADSTDTPISLPTDIAFQIFHRLSKIDVKWSSNLKPKGLVWYLLLNLWVLSFDYIHFPFMIFCCFLLCTQYFFVLSFYHIIYCSLQPYSPFFFCACVRFASVFCWIFLIFRSEGNPIGFWLELRFPSNLNGGVPAILTKKKIPRCISSLRAAYSYRKSSKQGPNSATVSSRLDRELYRDKIIYSMRWRGW